MDIIAFVIKEKTLEYGMFGRRLHFFAVQLFNFIGLRKAAIGMNDPIRGDWDPVKSESNLSGDVDRNEWPD